jgi:hypothetical protein
LGAYGVAQKVQVGTIRPLTSGHGRKAEHDMHADNRQEERIGGRDRDAQNDRCAFVGMTAY